MRADSAVVISAVMCCSVMEIGGVSTVTAVSAVLYVIAMTSAATKPVPEHQGRVEAPTERSASYAAVFKN